jgi:hypothetical protein
LDLIANNEAYISPWQGEIDIEIPVSVRITEEKVLDKATEKDKKVTVVDPDVKEYLEEEKEKKEKQTYGCICKNDLKKLMIKDKETRTEKIVMLGRCGHYRKKS